MEVIHRLVTNRHHWRRPKTDTEAEEEDKGRGGEQYEEDISREDSKALFALRKLRRRGKIFPAERRGHDKEQEERNNR